MNIETIGVMLIQDGYVIKNMDNFGRLLYGQREKNWIMLKT